MRRFSFHRHPVHGRSPRNRRWTTFAIGLSVRLMGLALIWMGDGGTSVWRQALVVIGVALSIGGIAVLRYLLISSLRKPRPGQASSSPAGGAAPRPER